MKQILFFLVYTIVLISCDSPDKEEYFPNPLVAIENCIDSNDELRILLKRHLQIEDAGEISECEVDNDCGIFNLNGLEAPTNQTCPYSYNNYYIPLIRSYNESHEVIRLQNAHTCPISQADCTYRNTDIVKCTDNRCTLQHLNELNIK